MAKKAEKKKGKPYLKKVAVAAFVMAAACVTLIFFGAFESLAFAGNAMSYDHRDIWLPLALLALGVFAAGTFLLPLLKGRVFRYSVTAVFALTLCGYLQSMLMNGSLGLLNGDGLQLSVGAILLNSLIWIAVFVGCFAVQQLSRPLWRGLLRYGALALAVMQLTSVVSIALGNHPSTTSMEKLCLTEEGMYEYSARDNIFVFVLDRLDYTYIQKVRKETPDYFDRLDGFTAYTNAMSAYGRTQPALNHLLTGSETAYMVAQKDFYADSWKEEGKAILEDLDALGYSSELYTKIRYLFSDPEYALRYAKNASESEKVVGWRVLPKLLRLSAYRWTPLALKKLLWTDTNYYNIGVFSQGASTAYEFDDSHYGPGFRQATANRRQSSFKLYHFYGSHSPYTMNADGTASEEETTVTEQTKGIFLHLYNAFDRMKELGIYEDATIIITADHGSAYKDSAPVQKPVTIGLFYKPSGSAGTPLQYSAAPVTTDNIGPTVMKAAGLADYSAYGQALDEVPEDEGLVRYYYKSVAETTDWHEVSVYKYAVTGDAMDFANWEVVEILEPLPAENRFY